MFKKVLALFLLPVLFLSGCGKKAESPVSDAPEIILYDAESNRFEDPLLPYGTGVEDAYKLMECENDIPSDAQQTFQAQFEPIRSLYGAEVITSAKFTDGVISAVSYRPAVLPDSDDEVFEEAIGWNRRFLELFGEDGYQTQELGGWTDAADVTIPQDGLMTRSAWILGKPGAQTKLVLTLTAYPDQKPSYNILISKV